jgi:hypothetical protein
MQTTCHIQKHTAQQARRESERPSKGNQTAQATLQAILGATATQHANLATATQLHNLSRCQQQRDPDDRGLELFLHWGTAGVQLYGRHGQLHSQSTGKMQETTDNRTDQQHTPPFLPSRLDAGASLRLPKSDMV